MRIVAGKYRGRKLAQFPGLSVRPTPDRVKESLFQILGARLVGARVLDLFCGSGALGLESLSRGAREAVFNDASPESVALCKKNLAALNESARVTQRDYRACLAGEAGQFDVIFCDPPYREDCAAEILTLAERYKRLSEGGIVVYESEREEGACAGWERFDLRNYGRTKVAFFRPAGGSL